MVIFHSYVSLPEGKVSNSPQETRFLESTSNSPNESLTDIPGRKRSAKGPKLGITPSQQRYLPKNGISDHEVHSWQQQKMSKKNIPTLWIDDLLWQVKNGNHRWNNTKDSDGFRWIQMDSASAQYRNLYPSRSLSLQPTDCLKLDLQYIAVHGPFLFENRSDLTPYVRNLQRETDESQDESQDSWESRPRQHKLQRPRPSFPRFSMRQLVPVPRFRAMIVVRLCQLPQKVLLMYETSFGFGRISVMTHTLLFSNVQGWKPLQTS